MIKCGGLPSRRAVTLNAVLAELPGSMIRIVGICVILLMTREAFRGGPGKLPVHVTLNAGCHDMPPSQRKRRLRVIEGGWTPSRCTMTLRASMAELSCRVIGIVDSLKIRLMTVKTGARGASKLTTRMTGSAIHAYMRTGQRKAGQIMIECRRLPATYCMTIRTGMRKLISGVIRVQGGLIISSMTGKTLSAGVGITSGVTSLTIVDGMTTRQGKSWSVREGDSGPFCCR
jgi:hypothetical protein